MKYTEGPIANTLLDRHGDKLTKESLDQLAESINSGYVPVNVEHDPRNPPLGRVVEGCVVKRHDGEYELFAKTEIFEPGDQVPFINSDRIVPLNLPSRSGNVVAYDRNFDNQIDNELIGKLEGILGGNASFSAKKALDPLSVLEIFGIFVAGGIASGFLGKVGSDAWDTFKSSIKELMLRKKPEEKERLLSFKAEISRESGNLLVETILTNPVERDIDKFFSEGLEVLDKITPTLSQLDSNVVQVTMEYKNEKFRIIYGVRSDSVPIEISLSFDDE